MLPMVTLNLPAEAIVGLFRRVLVFLFIAHFILQVIIFVRFARHAKEKRQWENILPEKNKVDVVIGELRGLQSKITSVGKVTTEKKVFWNDILNPKHHS